MDVRDDRQLAADAAADDLSAFAELVRRHQDFVFGAVQRVVKNPVVAEDLTQETFVRAYRGIKDFRGDSQVRSWLYRIGTNLALNAVSRRREYPTDQLPEPASPGGPEQAAVRSALGEALQEAMVELPENLRDPLMLREVHHLSYEEIAERLDLPVNTVRTRIFRARRAMQSKMEAWR